MLLKHTAQSYADLEKAFTQLKAIADTGHIEAQIQLSDFYNNGIGTEKNVDQALAILEKAKKAGSTKAQAFIGKVLINNFSKNEEQILSNLNESAKAGNPDAHYFLAQYYAQKLIFNASNRGFSQYFVNDSLRHLPKGKKSRSKNTLNQILNQAI